MHPRSGFGQGRRELGGRRRARPGSARCSAPPHSVRCASWVVPKSATSPDPMERRDGEPRLRPHLSSGRWEAGVQASA